MRYKLLVISLIITGCIKGQTLFHETTICSSESDFFFAHVNDSLQIIPREDAYIYINDYPIPFLTKNIPIDKDAECRNIRLSSEETQTIPHFTNQIIIKDSIYRNELDSIRYNGSHTIGGEKHISIQYSPFKWDSVHNQLLLRTKSTIHITLQQSNNSAKPKNSYNKPIISNSRKNSSTYALDSIQEDSCEYLIITNELLAPSFRQLSNWKTQKGVRAKVLTTEDIYSSVEGATNQIRIKQAIFNIYNSNSHHTLKYVLLGGDIDIVPAQMCYIQHQTISSQTPADLYYACPEQFDWDTNANGSAGEIADSINLTPTLTVARISVSSPTNAENIIRRIIEYEKEPKTQNWKNNILLCGTKMHSYSGAKSDAQVEGESLYAGISTYWDVEKTMLYDTKTDFPEGADYDFSTEHFQTELAKGYTFVNISTHGTPSAYTMEIAPNYTRTNAALLNNPGYTTIFTTACGTNYFDHINPCLSEVLLSSDKSGIIAYIGCSRYGISSLLNSATFNKKVYLYLLKNRNVSLAEALDSTKVSVVGFCNSYNYAYRWLTLATNMMGDPEMHIYTSCPTNFSGVSIRTINDSVLIDTGIDSCRVTISSRDDYGETIYLSMEAIRECTIRRPDIPCTICITKKGFIPYLDEIPTQKTFIQNKTFNEHGTITGKAITIGSDITNELPIGPVIISDGKTTINSSENVLIKNDFEVKRGAELEIK